jgi:hypothetical protein
VPIGLISAATVINRLETDQIGGGRPTDCLTYGAVETDDGIIYHKLILETNGNGKIASIDSTYKECDVLYIIEAIPDECHHFLY